MTTNDDDRTREAAAWLTYAGISRPASPVSRITPADAAHHAERVLEEAFEFVEAMGCVVSVRSSPHRIAFGNISIEAVHAARLPDAAAELGDLQLSVEITGLRLGLPMQRLYSETAASAMTRFNVLGELVRHPFKVGLASFRPVNARQLLLDHGWLPHWTTDATG